MPDTVAGGAVFAEPDPGDPTTVLGTAEGELVVGAGDRVGLGAGADAAGFGALCWLSRPTVSAAPPPSNRTMPTTAMRVLRGAGRRRAMGP